MWETTSSSIKVLENTYAKNRKLKIEVVTKMDNCFTICQYKTEKPKMIEITTSISLEISLFWCEVDILSLRSKISTLQTCHKKHGIKNVVKWDERLQLRRHSVVVITWLYPKTRMRISKALKKAYMLTFLYADLFTTFRYSNTMALILPNSLL